MAYTFVYIFVIAGERDFEIYSYWIAPTIFQLFIEMRDCFITCSLFPQIKWHFYQING